MATHKKVDLIITLLLNFLSSSLLITFRFIIIVFLQKNIVTGLLRVIINLQLNNALRKKWTRYNKQKLNVPNTEKYYSTHLELNLT